MRVFSHWHQFGYYKTSDFKSSGNDRHLTRGKETWTIPKALRQTRFKKTLKRKKKKKEVTKKTPCRTFKSPVCLYELKIPIKWGGEGGIDWEIGADICTLLCRKSLGWEDPLEKEMAIHSNILACRIPWTEETDRLQSIGSQRVRHDWSDLACTYVENT